MNTQHKLLTCITTHGGLKTMLHMAFQNKITSQKMLHSTVLFYLHHKSHFLSFKQVNIQIHKITLTVHSSMLPPTGSVFASGNL